MTTRVLLPSKSRMKLLSPQPVTVFPMIATMCAR